MSCCFHHRSTPRMSLAHSTGSVMYLALRASAARPSWTAGTRPLSHWISAVLIMGGAASRLLDPPLDGVDGARERKHQLLAQLAHLDLGVLRRQREAGVEERLLDGGEHDARLALADDVGRLLGGDAVLGQVVLLHLERGQAHLDVVERARVGPLAHGRQQLVDALEHQLLLLEEREPVPALEQLADALCGLLGRDDIVHEPRHLARTQAVGGSGQQLAVDGPVCERAIDLRHGLGAHGAILDALSGNSQTSRDRPKGNPPCWGSRGALFDVQSPSIVRREPPSVDAGRGLSVCAEDQLWGWVTNRARAVSGRSCASISSSVMSSTALTGG